MFRGIEAAAVDLLGGQHSPDWIRWTAPVSADTDALLREREAKILEATKQADAREAIRLAAREAG